MVTDHAPADLILQRAGRLHRHDRPERPAGLHNPQMWICRPQINDGGVPKFGHDAKVYDEHVLLRSWLELKERSSITIPNEVEALIEAVYHGHECPPGLLGAIRKRWYESLKRQKADLEHEQEEAEWRWIKHPSYRGQLWHFTSDTRDEDAPDFHQAHQALTRRAEPSVSVVLLSKDEVRDLDTLNPKELLKRSVNVSDTRILDDLKAVAVPKQWQTSGLLRHHRLIELEEDNTKRFGAHTLRYDVELGLVVDMTPTRVGTG